MTKRKDRFSALAPAPKPVGSTNILQSGARRLSGKRADPRYKQMTAYVMAETHQAVKEALIKDRKGMEISELVDELLKAWLARRKS